MRRSVRSLAIAVIAFLTLAACGGAPAASVAPSASVASSSGASEAPSTQPSAEATPSPTPTPRPLPSAEPSPSPTPEPTPTPRPSPRPTPATRSTGPTHAAGVEPGLLAKTVVSDVRIRSKPGLGADSVKLEPLLDTGARLMVLDGPVEASGYDWFLVDPRAYDENGRGLPTGWVAAGKDGEQWIKPLKMDCPAVPTNLDTLRKVASDYWLACFRGVEIAFNARLEQSGYACSSREPIEPAWFSNCATEYATDLVAPNAIRRLFVVWDPDVDLSIAARPAAPEEMWPAVKVIGQFDHPAAKACQTPNPGISDDLHRAQTVLTCRNMFVVTSMRLIEE